MKSNLNLLKIAVLLIALVIFSFGCSNSDNQQTGNENVTDSTAISSSEDTSAIPSEASTMASTETENVNIRDAESNQTTATENNAAQEKVVKNTPKSGTSATNTTSKQANVQKPPVEKPATPIAQPKTSEPKPEPVVVPPTEKPSPKEPVPPVSVTPKTEEKPAPPVKTEVPKPAPTTTAEPTSDWPVPEKDRNMTNPVKADKESLSIGKSLYNKHCASCHGKKGLGDGAKAAQLDTPCGDFSTDSFHKQTDGSLYYKTVTGRDDMPSYKKKIPYAEDVWSIVNYIRTFK